MKCTAIVFDLGNVIITNDIPPYHTGKQLGKFIHDLDVPLETITNAFRMLSVGYFTGEFSENIFWKKFLDQTHVKTKDVVYLKSFYRRYQEPLETMLFLLSELKKHYRLFVLTNIGREWLDFKIKKFHIDTYFETIISSGYTGFMKPNPLIFDLFIRTTHINPKECLYIDDKKNNIETADEFGMQTILFTNEQLLRKKLKQLHVL